MADPKKPTPPDAPKEKPKESTGVGVKERAKAKLDKPRKWKVILHNDDYTPMEFVTACLEQIFHKTPAEATRIMLTVHNTGIGVAGVYSMEVAEAKAQQTLQAARSFGYPLLATTEPE